MNADGTDQVDLTKTQYLPEEIINFEPTWSPDGSKVAFMRQSQSKGQDIWVMNSDGSDPVDLTNTAGASETAPEFSPDGTKIVYINGAENDDIWVMNANGTGQTPLTETSAPVQNVAPTWSPDGSKIAYSVLEGPVGERGLHVMGADGTSKTQLLDESAPILSDVLSWSPQRDPDRLQVGGHRRRTAPRRGLRWSYRPAGREQRRRLSELGLDPRRPRGDPSSSDHSGLSAVVSPDGDPAVSSARDEARAIQPLRARQGEAEQEDGYGGPRAVGPRCGNRHPQRSRSEADDRLGEGGREAQTADQGCGEG
jgi:dipeptidyl aminopeptidase/acylaminoacyl peptidase